MDQRYIYRHSFSDILSDSFAGVLAGKVCEVYFFFADSHHHFTAADKSFRERIAKAEMSIAEIENKGIILMQIHIFRSENMFEKYVSKGMLSRLVTVLLIASVAILALSILNGSKDGRKQIIDSDGASEERLCSILSGIKGADEVEVIVKYDNDSQVSGVIVSAVGAENPVVANKLTNGVATLYNIPVSSVIVFEKEQEE